MELGDILCVCICVCGGSLILTSHLLGAVGLPFTCCDLLVWPAKEMKKQVLNGWGEGSLVVEVSEEGEGRQGEWNGMAWRLECMGGKINMEYLIILAFIDSGDIQQTEELKVLWISILSFEKSLVLSYVSILFTV